MSAIVIGSGDLLKVSVFGAPESDQEVRVDPDGNVSLNFIGSVHLAGLSSTAAQDLIAKKLKDGGFFAQPQVSVFTKEYATQGVSVLGEVQKPGVYPMLGSRRLFDVISMAGGTSPKAGRIVAISHRDHPEAPLSYTLSNDPTESAKSNVEVFPGDTVVVARAGIVYVVGDVHKPSGVLMDNGTNITVLQAIAMAEGTNNTAALNKAKLIRTTATGPPGIAAAVERYAGVENSGHAAAGRGHYFCPQQRGQERDPAHPGSDCSNRDRSGGVRGLPVTEIIFKFSRGTRSIRQNRRIQTSGGVGPRR